jgi:hypothetical protein
VRAARSRASILDMVRKLVAVMIGLAVLVITPYFLFFRFDYDDADLRAAIEGTWRLTLPGQESLVLSIAEAKAPAQHASRSFVRSAAACGHRTFVRSAEACIDSTEMELVVTTEPASAPGRGRIEVTGRTFQAGRLELELAELNVFGKVQPGGSVADVEAYGLAGGKWAAGIPGATLVRVAR